MIILKQFKVHKGKSLTRLRFESKQGKTPKLFAIKKRRSKIVKNLKLLFWKKFQEKAESYLTFKNLLSKVKFIAKEKKLRIEIQKMFKM